MFKTLTHETMKQYAPSIFTGEGAQRTSEKYKHISTIELVDGLIKEGFMPVTASQSRSRSQQKRLYTKHMLRFRHVNEVQTADGLFPELVLINSHDGLCSYKLMAGVYRMVCSNGLIAGSTFKEIRIRHQGDIMGNVIEGTYEVMKEAQRAIEHAEAMGGVQLSNDEKIILAETVHQLRFDGDDSITKNAIKPEQFLRPRRSAEVGKNDLFSVMNVAQENVIRGGLRGVGRDEAGRLKRVTTRHIKSIDQNNILNRAIWTLAEKMKELKAG